MIYPTGSTGVTFSDRAGEGSADSIDIMPIHDGRRTPQLSIRNRSISIHRALYDQEKFDKEFGLLARPKLTPVGHIKAKATKTSSKWQNPKRWRCTFSGLFPVVRWLPHYRLREHIVPDLLAGLTVGIMVIPQGLAYALLAGLPTVYGLYMGVFQALIYALFGTSRQMSIGVDAIISLMVGTCLADVANQANAELAQGTVSIGYFSQNIHAYNGSSFTNGSGVEGPNGTYVCPYNDNDISYDYAMCSRILSNQDLTMITGLFSFAFGFLRCGFVGDLLSDQLTQGLTTGAAVQIASSQVAHLFGILNLPRTSGVLGLPKFYYQLFKRIHESNYVTVILSALALTVLLIHKIKTGPMFTKKFTVPLPLELIVVIIITGISYALQLYPKHNVIIVGKIPEGLPVPTLPHFTRLGTIIPQAFVIAIITFALQISIAKIYAKKHGYTIDANQEWFATGFVNTISSFFHCWASGASIPRTAVLEGTGGKTQVANFVVASMMIVVLLAIAGLFATLPNCILAAVICAALVNMLRQVQILPTLWRQSKCDFMIFLTACVGVILLDMAFGLLAAVVVSVITLLYRTIWPHTRLLGRLKNTNEYEAPDVYFAASEINHIKIFRFEAPLFYGNVTNFKEKLYKATVNPVAALKKLKKAQKRARTAGRPKISNLDRVKGIFHISGKVTNAAVPPQTETNVDAGDTIHSHEVEQRSVASWPDFGQRNDIYYIIIDCSSISFIDFPGCTALKEICLDFEKIDIPILLACCNVGFREMMARVHFHEYIPKTAIFVSIHDAVLAVQLQRKLTEVPSNGVTLSFIEEHANEEGTGEIGPTEGAGHM